MPRAPEKALNFISLNSFCGFRPRRCENVIVATKVEKVFADFARRSRIFRKCMEFSRIPWFPTCQNHWYFLGNTWCFQRGTPPSGAQLPKSAFWESKITFGGPFRSLAQKAYETKGFVAPFLHFWSQNPKMASFFHFWATTCKKGAILHFWSQKC